MRSPMAGLTGGLVVLLFSSVAYGQAITARIRVTMTGSGSNGQVTTSHVEDGVYYRTSAGDTLSRYTTFDGNPTTGELAWARLQENGANYQLDYGMHRAYVVSPTQFTPPIPPKMQGALGQSSVEGIPCKLFPVYATISGRVTRVGSSCYSEAYHLILKFDVTNPGPDGRSARNVMEMYGIQIGLEPDPKLFDLTHNFTIYKPEAPGTIAGKQQMAH